MFSAIKPVITVVDHGNQISVHMDAGPFQKDYKLEFGKELADVAPNGKPAKFTCTRVGANKLHEDIIFEDGFKCTADWEFEPSGLLMVRTRQ